MFVRWRKKPIASDARATFLRDADPGGEESTPWKPLTCAHRGPDRIAWTAEVVQSVRGESGPRQSVLESLPTIRSCCIADPFARAAWWHSVGETIRLWETERPWHGPKNSARPHDFIRQDKAAVVAKLREVVPKPTAAGARVFKAYREGKEGVHRAHWDREREARDRERVAQEQQWEEQDRREEQKWEREEAERRRKQEQWDKAQAEHEAWKRQQAEREQKREEAAKAKKSAKAKARRKAKKEEEAKQKAAGQETDSEKAARRERERAQERERERDEQKRAGRDRERARRDRPASGEYRPGCFAVLDLPPDATVDQIKARRHELAKLHHPDKHPEATAKQRAAYTRKMAEINQAGDEAMKWAEYRTSA